MGLTDLSNNFSALKAMKVSSWFSVCAVMCVCKMDTGKYLPSCRGFDGEAVAVLKYLDLIISYYYQCRSL